jgi:branched-chain amino acid aminotransferase
MNETLFFYFDGSKILSDLPPFPNRGFKYADGFFETILLQKGFFPFLSTHVLRIQYSIKKLAFRAPEFFFEEKYWQNTLKNLCKNEENARLRLSFFRSGNGFYLPEENAETAFFLEIMPLKTPNLLFRRSPKRYCIIQNARKNFSIISEIKAIGAQIYVLAALEMRENNAQEAILLNDENEIVECLSANIFIRKNDTLFTPPLRSGAVAGVMRAFLLKNLPKYGIKIIEKKLFENDIETADALLSVNALTGVSIFEEKIKDDFFDRLPQIVSENC